MATYMYLIIKTVNIRVESDLSETDQSYEVSCHDKNFVLCPMRYSCSGVIEKINLREEIGA